jgi:hypothetical protein
MSRLYSISCFAIFIEKERGRGFAIWKLSFAFLLDNDQSRVKMHEQPAECSRHLLRVGARFLLAKGLSNSSLVDESHCDACNCQRSEL